MTYRLWHKKYIKNYQGCKFIFDERRGYIVWRQGTGENIEILHLRVWIVRQGYATYLMHKMIKKIKPYHSVFVFTLASNKVARKVYKSWGFELTKIKELYKNDNAIIGCVSYETLKNNLLR